MFKNKNIKSLKNLFLTKKQKQINAAKEGAQIGAGVGAVILVGLLLLNSCLRSNEETANNDPIEVL